jgi:hypothetical protein
MRIKSGASLQRTTDPEEPIPSKLLLQSVRPGTFGRGPNETPVILGDEQAEDSVLLFQCHQQRLTTLPCRLPSFKKMSRLREAVFSSWTS